MKILVAVDGSRHALAAVESVVEHAAWYREKPEIELVTVHLPVPQLPGMGAAVGRQQIARYYEDEGGAKLAVAKKRLEVAKLPYRAQVLVGQVAEAIVKHARTARCDLICMGSRGMTGIKNALLGSTATKVLHLADRPVLIIK
jgi:nucleotide-binding universal stress UspA family protein